MVQGSPLFVVIEPTGAHAREPTLRVSWACEAEIGSAHGDDLQNAGQRIAALSKTHALHLADPLFDEPRLAAIFADAGLAPPPEARDWLLALAPFRQARNLAAIMEVAAERAPPDNPAAQLFEAWREARVRAQPKT